MADHQNAKDSHSSDTRFEGNEKSGGNKTENSKKGGEKQRQTDTSFADEKPHIPTRSTGLCAIASLLLVIACLFLIRFETNRVGSLRINAGNYVTEEQVSAIVGNTDGKYLPALDTKRMEEKIKALSPMVADVKFELSLTRTLNVRVIDENYCYYYRTENDKILLLNSSFKALGYHPSGSCKTKDCAYEKGALTELYIQAPQEIVIGEVLGFDGKDELSPFVLELNGQKGTLYESLNLLDIRNARHIVFIFDHLVCVELSEAKDLDIKCLALEKMMVKRKTREEEIETRFTYVDPVSGSIYWAVEEWANLYEDYPNPDRP